MAVLKLVYEGDPRLRQKAVRIRKVDDDLRRLAADMLETMYAADGVGLAGPQVGVMRRIVVIGVPAGFENEDDPPMEMALINPEIVRASGRQVGPEGCLSIPNWYGDVPRAMHVTVKARDLDDREIRIKASGPLARILQHEIDHLDGILFTDRVEDKSTLQFIEPAPVAEEAPTPADD
ncbi:peptide deformylase [Sphaerobacter sp.]|uniref:peptide deformylase n=1 Tax=Sphaerobacter sp. TaxID=2099654 RepID=UPI001DF71CA7|nr:peptide deformylase [Sphaerobacter sp.]MBX5444993.1 peptide deformylase [Sphaerobacter sp.]